MKCLFLVICTHVALAQRPGLPQPVGRYLSDSTSLATVTPPQYDFYYSTTQAQQYVQISITSYALEDRLKRHRFRDKLYTEVVPKGLKHLSSFDDFVLIGSGTMADAKDNGDW